MTPTSCSEHQGSGWNHPSQDSLACPPTPLASAQKTQVGPQGRSSLHPSPLPPDARVRAGDFGNQIRDAAWQHLAGSARTTSNILLRGDDDAEEPHLCPGVLGSQLGDGCPSTFRSMSPAGTGSCSLESDRGGEAGTGLNLSVRCSQAVGVTPAQIHHCGLSVIIQGHMLPT